MPIIGNDSKPTFAAHGYGGSSQPNQEAEDITMPDQRIRILRLGAWIGGWSDNPRVRLTVWDPGTGAVLGQSAEFNVADEGTVAVNHIAKYTADLAAPYETPTPGMVLRVGFTRHRDDAHQVVAGSLAGGHQHGRGGYPSGAFAEVDGFNASRRIGAWVEDYETLASAWVFRSGVWVRSDAVKVYRSGAWVDADAVQVNRSGSWVDAD